MTLKEHLEAIYDMNLIYIEEEDQWLCYSPDLDLYAFNGMGNTPEEAISRFNKCKSEVMEYLDSMNILIREPRRRNTLIREPRRRNTNDLTEDWKCKSE